MTILGDLSGRTALVSGAGSELGIGFATAVALGQLGARVFVTSTTDRIYHRVEELQHQGIEASGCPADLTSPDGVESLWQAACAEFGDVSVLVNNAGMTAINQGDDRVGEVETITLDQWHQGLARNLDTAFLVTRRFLPQMKAAGWGRVLMVASTTGPVNSMPGHAVYSSAKAALVGLTRSIALEVALEGVTVNAVGPGWIATGSASSAERGYGAASPLGRSGTPNEVAAVICALCLPGMSYLTGQLLVVDGANSILESRGN